MDRDEYELDKWFGGTKTNMSDITHTKKFHNINDTDSLKFISEISPDILVSFGIGKIRSEMLDLYKGRLVNLHGGNPEEYRGLDSHLWAIYHGDFDNLITKLPIFLRSVRFGSGRVMFKSLVKLLILVPKNDQTP